MNENTRPKRRIPYWLALIVGTLLTCIGTSLLLMLWFSGAFTSWGNLAGPPSGIKRIISFDPSLKWMWVEANNGTYYYSTTVVCSQYSSDDPDIVCATEGEQPIWKPAKDLPKDPEQKIAEGSNCTSLSENIFPLNPIGQIRECIHIYYKDYPSWNEEIYIALMADGSLKFWESPQELLPPRFFIYMAAMVVFPFIAGCLITVIYIDGARK